MKSECEWSVDNKCEESVKSDLNCVVIFINWFSDEISLFFRRLLLVRLLNYKLSVLVHVCFVIVHTLLY